MKNFWINNKLTNKSSFIISTILFVVFMIIVLPFINWLNNNYIGVTSSPDTMIFYSANRFYLLMEEYGVKGRNLYIFLRWTFDLVYPIVYGWFFVSLLVYLMKKLKHIYYWMLYLVILAVLMDYLENIFSTINVAIFPKKIPLLVYIMQGTSLLKWLFIILVMINILVLTFFYIKQKNKT